MMKTNSMILTYLVFFNNLSFIHCYLLSVILISMKLIVLDSWHELKTNYLFETCYFELNWIWLLFSLVKQAASFWLESFVLKTKYYFIQVKH